MSMLDLVFVLLTRQFARVSRGKSSMQGTRSMSFG